jgi:nitrogen fixation/metabolism regulation signal transduction histidine kinase
MEEVTKTIIDQIDTLSSIATEFSNFAKMPRANYEKIDLHQTLTTALSLFRDLENIQLEFKSELEEDAFVLADREQMLRVFNNLLKNAVQAIPETRKGLLKVVLKSEKDNFLVIVTDNGIGIDNSVIHKIFTPNFTTKNAGMGLGLAMVKNIIENTGGHIWFETKVDVGTTFFVSIPPYKSNH